MNVALAQGVFVPKATHCTLALASIAVVSNRIQRRKLPSSSPGSISPSVLNCHQKNVAMLLSLPCCLANFYNKASLDAAPQHPPKKHAVSQQTDCQNANTKP